MPNWVTNRVTIRGDDEALREMALVVEEDGDEGLFHHLIPCPQDLTDTVKGFMGEGPEQDALEAREAENIRKHGYPTWYEFNCSKWGTKWDAGSPDVVSQKKGELVLQFDTAWSPPVPIFIHLVNEGFEVEAVWYEEGIQSWGRFNDGLYNHSAPDSFDEYDTLGPKKFYEGCLPEGLLETFPELVEMIDDEQFYWEDSRDEEAS